MKQFSIAISALAMAFSAPVNAQTAVIKNTPQADSVITAQDLKSSNMVDAADNILVDRFFGLTAASSKAGTAYTGAQIASHQSTYDFLIHGDMFQHDEGLRTSDAVTADIIHNEIGMTAVPEPEVWAMFILGMIAVGFGLRRRRRLNDEVGYDNLV